MPLRWETEKTGRCGQPRIIIPKELIWQVSNPASGISRVQAARYLKIHRNTLLARQKAFGPGVFCPFSKISDNDLDDIVLSLLEKYPNTGQAVMLGRLRARGLKMSSRWVRLSLSRVDPLGQALQEMQRKKTPRGVYKVAWPHALWHMDGHHKLIRWGFVIHRMINGYTCLVRAPSNCSPCFIFIASTRWLVAEHIRTIAQKRFSIFSSRLWPSSRCPPVCGVIRVEKTRTSQGLWLLWEEARTHRSCGESLSIMSALSVCGRMLERTLQGHGRHFSIVSRICIAWILRRSAIFGFCITSFWTI